MITLGGPIYEFDILFVYFEFYAQTVRFIELEFR